jgi:hypothetical protein
LAEFEGDWQLASRELAVELLECRKGFVSSPNLFLCDEIGESCPFAYSPIFFAVPLSSLAGSTSRNRKRHNRKRHNNTPPLAAYTS